MAHDDSAQREMEQKALRNVRGLVDKIESEDKIGNQKQVLGAVILVIIVAALAAAFLMGQSKDAAKPGPAAIELPPATKPVSK